MKKLFGGINLTWPKLIIFAIISALYTAIIALIPALKETSFYNTAVYFESWIVIGIIIILNSKSPLDSALKCFVYFLISQPLIYLFQVPFSSLGFRLLSYYKNWIVWTILTFPMGFIGYYIKKKNLLSMFILLPMLIFLVIEGVGFLSSAIDDFPKNVLSAIFCFVSSIIIILYVFDNKKIKIISIGLLICFAGAYVILKGGLFDVKFESYYRLDDYILDIGNDAFVSYYSREGKGNVELIKEEDGKYTIKVSGTKRGKYTFKIADENDHEYSFEYYFDNNEYNVILNKLD